MTRGKPLFECHLTYEGVTSETEAQLDAFAKQHGWKTSFIEGDPLLGPGKRFFLTAHANKVQDLYAQMKRAAENGPVAPIREKIEAIVHDSKYGIEL